MCKIPYLKNDIARRMKRCFDSDTLRFAVRQQLRCRQNKVCQIKDIDLFLPPHAEGNRQFIPENEGIKTPAEYQLRIFVQITQAMPVSGDCTLKVWTYRIIGVKHF